MIVKETRMFKAQYDVDRRLAEIALTRDRLQVVVATALSAAADATLFHPRGAAGVLAYLYGVYGLRDQFSNEWDVCRLDGVEMIQNSSIKVRVGYSNVDKACDDDHDPQARRRKGSGTERACQGNLFEFLPWQLPKSEGEWTTYFLMVDPNGAAELSRPMVIGDNFGPFIERIYVTDGLEFDDEGLLFDEGDVVDDFDPKVIRR